MSKVAILQSAYIPWRGYFDLIASVDVFVFLDDVQFTNQDWRNRNVIKTAQGLRWLTIPVPKKSRIKRTINQIEIEDTDWGRDHWNRISESYRKARHFETIEPILKPLFQSPESNLSSSNLAFIRHICTFLNIATETRIATGLYSSTERSQRLLDICRSVGCYTYVSGPAAKDYLDVEVLKRGGVTTEWFSYDDLMPYPQLHGDFLNAVSIVDLLLNCGPDAYRHLPALAHSSR
ncbi:WbqC family protein [Devosia lacusdianchii]|uniref:WbqC family protein n=1 Tax=Devosia lacusdianchii TaxID=2917991 RepID=UPI001F06EE5F|nr:WbqC family protein [Devosia sp. JXJ CY 41]